MAETKDEDGLATRVKAQVERVCQANGTELILDNWGLGDNDMQEICLALTNVSFTTLSLENNRIGDDGVIALAMFLVVNKSITTIKLSQNQIGPRGARALSHALEVNNIFSTLELNHNCIGDDGAVDLAVALVVNQTLTSIGLSHNQIGNRGIAALAKVLEVNITVSTLNLRNNLIGDDGAQSLASSLIFNHTLLTLDLNQNHIGETGTTALQRAAQERANSPVNLIADVQYLEIYRTRVMLVGPGNAGKTTLAHRLRTGKFLHELPMTDGIVMNDWTPEPAVTLSLWDFAGQAVYLNTHPILFSERSLYLLIWSPRAHTSVHSTRKVLEEYLLNIRSCAKTSPIIFISTCSSETSSISSMNGTQDLFQKYQILKYHAVDSKTGEGIEELKASLMQLVTEGECREFAKAFIPNWFSVFENEIRVKAKTQFSLSRNEFLEIFSAALPPSLGLPEAKSNAFQASIDETLSLLHHWGLIFLLPNNIYGTQTCISGDESKHDIILDPQRLSDVLKTVITCRNSDKHGIINHNSIDEVWSEERYVAIRQYFLPLLHSCELAFEIFDEHGNPTQQSLIPCLLDEIHLPDEPELLVRENFLKPWENLRNPKYPPTFPMISRGCVTIAFDSLLTNIFPKLLVRIRPWSSSLPTDFSRHHCVIHVPYRDATGAMLGYSVACVVESLQSYSLVVYPGGLSYDAAAIIHQAIRSIIDDQHVTVTLEVGNEVFRHNKISEILALGNGNGNGRLHVLGQGDGIPLSFLSCLFKEPHRPHPLDQSLFSLQPSERQLLSNLQSHSTKFQESHSTQFQESPGVYEKCYLTRSLVLTLSIFRQLGLGIRSDPKILWLVGKGLTTFHLFAVSPPFDLHFPWEVVWESEIIVSVTAIPHSEFPQSDLQKALSEILLGALVLLLPDQQLPNLPQIKEWIGLMKFPDSAFAFVSDSDSVLTPVTAPATASVAEMISKAERELFEQNQNQFHEMGYYSKLILIKQKLDVATRGDLEDLVSLLSHTPNP